MTNPLTALFGDRAEKKAWDAMGARADALPRGRGTPSPKVR